MSAGPIPDSLPPDVPDPDVSVVIVNYNVRDFLSQAVRSVQTASRDLSVETWVVDNNSIDGSVDMLREDFPRVHVIANRENVGFGAANNQAIHASAGRYILILNPDTILQEDTLTALVAFMDAHPETGAAGCQILNPDGTFAPESRRSFPTPATAFYRMTGLSRLFPRSPRFGRYNLTHVPRDQVTDVDALSGSCMMVRREAIRQAGAFDEDFFMYGEDLDLCFRIQKAGWRIVYTPDTQIIHYKGESTKKGDFRYVRLFYGAMLLFMDKHMTGRGSRPLALLLKAGIMIRAGMTLCGNTMRRLSAPLADAALVIVIVSAVGALRFWMTDTSFAVRFFLTIAPAYALATVAGILLLGGYDARSRNHLRAAFLGTVLGFLIVGTLSFFIQDIAFSRWVVALSLPVAAAILVAGRVVRAARQRGSRKALLVGGAGEAERLRRMLASHPSPPFRLEGYVSDDRSGETDLEETRPVSPALPLLGGMSQLRDLVRLRGYTDIVFAARDTSNQAIFTAMRNLHDLRVHVRMLNEGDEHVVGKSSVAHVSLASLQGTMPEVVSLPSARARRLRHRLMGLGVLAVWPLLWPVARLAPRSSPLRRLVGLRSGLVDVVRGRLALVGCAPIDADRIPRNWDVACALFPVMNTSASRELEPDERLRAYWYYVTHASIALDLEIIGSHLRYHPPTA
ncbi:MAG: glycosyltransferase [Rhodothermales bacterium]